MQAELWWVLSRNMVAHQEWWAGLDISWRPNYLGLHLICYSPIYWAIHQCPHNNYVGHKHNYWDGAGIPTKAHIFAHLLTLFRFPFHSQQPSCPALRVDTGILFFSLQLHASNWKWSHALFESKFRQNSTKANYFWKVPFLGHFILGGPGMNSTFRQES